MSTLTIRQARPDDCPLILQFIRDLALYERALDEVQATVPQLEALLFGENPRVYGVICEEDGEALGFATWHKSRLPKAVVVSNGTCSTGTSPPSAFTNHSAHGPRANGQATA